MCSIFSDDVRGSLTKILYNITFCDSVTNACLGLAGRSYFVLLRTILGNNWHRGPGVDGNRDSLHPVLLDLRHHVNFRPVNAHPNEAQFSILLKPTL